MTSSRSLLKRREPAPPLEQGLLVKAAGEMKLIHMMLLLMA